MTKQANRPVGASVVRSILVLLTLAFALWVAPFAPGQRRNSESSKRTLAFPSSLLEQQKKTAGSNGCR